MGGDDLNYIIMIKKIIFSFFIISIFLLPSLCLGEGEYYGLKETAVDSGLSPSSGSTPAPQNIIAKIIGYILAMIGIILLVQIIFAGYTWMLSGGNEEKIKKSRDKIINSVIGVAIILIAYVAVNALFDLLFKVTQT